MEFIFDSDKGVFPDWSEYPLVVLVTSIIWIAVTFLQNLRVMKFFKISVKKFSQEDLDGKKFIDKTTKKQFKVDGKINKWNVPSGILAMLFGCGLIYSIMFATGYIIYGSIKLLFY